MDKLINIVTSSDEKFKITDEDIKKAKYHKLESFLYLACDKQNTAPEVLKEIKLLQMKSIKKDVVQMNTLREILELFEREKIDCLPLKGCLLKEYYQHTFLRYMGDIDILIKEEDMTRATKLLENMDFIKKGNSYNHLALEKKPYLEVELHRKLLPYNSEGSHFFDDIWNRVVLVEKSKHTYKMSQEDFLSFMLFHLHKHYSGSGMGLRSFLDVYIYLNKHPNLNVEKVLDQAETVGLRSDFEDYMGFSQKIFNFEKLDDKYCAMKEKVKNSGVFGSSLIRAKNDLDKHKRSLFITFFSKIFPPKDFMIQSFPILKKHIYLLPLFYVVKFFRIVFLTPVKSLRKALGIMRYKKRAK